MFGPARPGPQPVPSSRIPILVGFPHLEVRWRWQAGQQVNLWVTSLKEDLGVHSSGLVDKLMLKVLLE